MLTVLTAFMVLPGGGAQEAPTQGPEFVVSRVYFLKEGGGAGKPRMYVEAPDGKLEPPRISPLHKWEFPFLTRGYVKNIVEGQTVPRFRVYHQRNQAQNDPSIFVTRALLRLWDFNYTQLRLDHKASIARGMVDVYLCWGGQPGGEQRFDSEVRPDDPSQVIRLNTIYIYRLDSFTDPVEMIREIAHEYGHAALPPVGGFKKPENWANGYLGEKLYLRYLRDELLSRRLEPADAMGATYSDLDPWVRENVDTLAAAAASKGPDIKLLKQTSMLAMESYIGLALYSQSILPSEVFSRSITAMGSVKAADYPASIISAVTSRDQVRLSIPPNLIGKRIWIPMPPLFKEPSARIFARRGSWAQIKAFTPTVTLIK